MSALVWGGSFVLVALLGGVSVLTATYDQVQRDRAANDHCGCPQHDAGGTCER